MELPEGQSHSQALITNSVSPLGEQAAQKASPASALQGIEQPSTDALPDQQPEDAQEVEAAADPQPEPAGTAQVQDGADTGAADELNVEAPADQGEVEEAEASAAPEVNTKPAEEEEPAATEADLVPPNTVSQANEAINTGEAQNNKDDEQINEEKKDDANE